VPKGAGIVAALAAAPVIRTLVEERRNRGLETMPAAGR
jgi:hypothetical protein